MIRIDGRQIDMRQHDSDFDSGRVSNLKGLQINGSVFTISEREKSGTYDYDCGRNYTMIVEIKTGVGEGKRQRLWTHCLSGMWSLSPATGNTRTSNLSMRKEL
jgi:hypothetical protein